MRHKTIKGIIDLIIGVALFTVDAFDFVAIFNSLELLNQYGYNFPYVLKGAHFLLLLLAIFLFLVMNQKYIVKSSDILISIIMFLASFMVFLIRFNLRFTVIYYWLDSIAILLSFLVYTSVSKKSS